MINRYITKIIVILSIILLCIALIGAVLFIYECSYGPKVSSRKNDFIPIIEAYNKVANYYYDDFEKNNFEYLIYSVPYDENDKDIVCFTDERTIIIDDEILKSIYEIMDSYYLDKQPLDYIAVYEGFVSFCNNNGRSSYVYSVYDEEPDYINSPRKKNDRIYKKKITEHWYFLCTR